MDEFVQLGWVKYLGNGLFDTIWHPKAVGYLFFYKLAHLIGWDATSILLAGRGLTALLACGTLALVYGCARALGHDRPRSLIIVLVLLSFSNFIERIFRTIAEPLAVFFAVASMLVVLRGRADQARTIVLAGMLSGLAFLCTQKAIYFNVALGLALVIDAALARRWRDGIMRGLWLLLGWTIPIIAYCILFGGGDPLPIARNLFLGPIEIATTGGDVYPNLRNFVWQTLVRNALLYAFCFAGIALTLLRLTRLDERSRVALIFTIVVTALVFAHNQPWPYVFVMALPFMALWSLEPLDRLSGKRRYLGLAWLVLGIAILASFARNLSYLAIDNRAQLELVARAERLVGPDDIYFDGVAMLPNRREPSALWLDRAFILRTLREKQGSEAFRIFANRPPKLIIWSSRMDGIEPVIAPLIRDSYVRVSPNIRIAGRRLEPGRAARFNVPLAGHYALYDSRGRPMPATVEVDGTAVQPPFRLDRGPRTVTLATGTGPAFLLPEGSYRGAIGPGRDHQRLFEGVYR